MNGRIAEGRVSLLPYTRGEARAWARDHLRGVANVIIPSFSTDLSSINEAGIRLDVNRNVELGFVGCLLVSETATTFDEYTRFVAIAAEEAQGRQVLIHHASFNTLEQSIASAERAAELGAVVTLLSYPPGFYPRSTEDVESYTRAFCNAVDLAVVIFPVPLWGFERLHPASMPIDLLERLVDDLPTVVAIKAEGGHPGIAGFIQVWKRLQERVVVTMPLEHHAIPLATLLPTPFVGTSNGEYYGSSIPQMLALALDGKHDEAFRQYWKIDPARQANAKANGIGGWNSVHRMLWKYQAWLNGYNGGPLRMPTPRIVDEQMVSLRNGLISSGLAVTEDPDELYFVGRCP
jgi:4-hydroxy-tetrahydrodipicolinate synthase